MGKYFGTDGFRGEANKDLTAAQAFEVGRILGLLAVQAQAADDKCACKTERPHIIIGKDTRRSGDMLEHALAAGITASGSDAYLLGVVTTPGVAYLTRMGNFSFGVMVSASHNPYQDNGIKVLNAQGEKLEDTVTAAIENLLDGDPAALAYAERNGIGVVVDHHDACEKYAQYLISLAKKRFTGYKVGLDCANGSAYALGREVFETLGATVTAISTQPNGLNINVDCGSTHIHALEELVAREGLDVGFAFDGDADRCLAVDETGACVNGDQIMYLSAVHMKETGHLTTNTVVTTIMSNFGLYKALDDAGISYEKTAVGDKYVYENMAANGHVIGGEQSGHVIFQEFATTGDGILTAIMVMEALIASGKKLSQLAEPMTMYPQVLKNVRVTSKPAALGDETVQAAITAAGDALKDTGRVLVRQSGTEPVIRVMAEAPDVTACEKHVDAIIAVMRAAGHIAE